MKVRVCLPAFNEEAALRTLLPELVSVLAELDPPGEVLVVDDGSSDGTASVAESFALSRVSLLRHKRNLGLGRAIDSGLRECAERGGADDVVVTMDADGTHPPRILLDMLREISAGADVVVGSRYVPGAEVHGVPWHRRLYSRLGSLLFRALAPASPLKDYTCGYRAYRAETLRQAFATWQGKLVTEAGFACMLEIVLKLRRQSVRFAEVPLILHYELKPGPSKMRIFLTIRRSLALAFSAPLNRS